MAETNKREVEVFIKRLYKLPQEQRVTLTDSDSIDAACYRKLVFRSSSSRVPLIMYLAPDGKHLVSGVVDMTVDPVVVQKQRQREYASKLAAGALLRYGIRDAPVTMVVFGDFQCPYCKTFTDMVRELSADEQASVEKIYRQFPLSNHSWATEAAELSTCVALQDKVAFWKLHDFLFSHQRDISKASVEASVLEFVSQETTVDPGRVKTCVQRGEFASTLRKDEQLAADLGITGTPSIFVNGERIVVRSVEELRSALRAATREETVSMQGHDK